MPGQTLKNFKSIRDIVVALVTCKNEEDQIKIEGARVVAILYIDFQTLKGT